MPDFVLHTGHDLVDQLQAYRRKMGLTQDDIAWKLGFSSTTVSRWERGVAVPDLRATGATPWERTPPGKLAFGGLEQYFKPAR